MISTKITFLLVLGVALTIANDLPARGGIKQLSGDGLKEAEDTLNDSLSKLANGDGPNYKLGRLISATRQTVSGSKYTYEVELIDGNNTKTCNVVIWSQPWLENGIEVTFNCQGEEQVVKKHNA